MNVCNNSPNVPYSLLDACFFVSSVDCFLTEHGRFLTMHGRFLTERGRFLTERGRFLTERGRFLTEHGRFLTERGRFLTERGCFSIIDSFKISVFFVKKRSNSVKFGLNSANLGVFWQSCSKPASMRPKAGDCHPRAYRHPCAYRFLITGGRLL